MQGTPSDTCNFDPFPSSHLARHRDLQPQEMFDFAAQRVHFYMSVSDRHVVINNTWASLFFFLTSHLQTF